MFFKVRRPAKFCKDTMRDGTGKEWNEWVAILKPLNKDQRSMSAMTNYLTRKYELTPAWARTIAAYFLLEHR
jgi:hypothetical protein